MSRRREATGRDHLRPLLGCFFFLLGSGCERKAQVDPAEVQRLVQAALERARAAEGNASAPRSANATAADSGAALASADAAASRDDDDDGDDNEDGDNDRDSRRASSESSVALVSPRCLSAEGAAHVRETATLLNNLKELMEGFAPQRTRPPAAPRLCLTAIAARNDRMGADLEQSLTQDYRQQASAAAAVTSRARAEFMRNRPIAWTWLRVWMEGQPVTIGPRLIATQEPELTRRVREGHTLHPDAPVFCSVRAAEVQRDVVKVTCNGPLDFEPRNVRQEPGNDQTFVVELPASLAEPNAALANLGIGDLIRVQGHLMITRRFDRCRAEEGCQWIVQEVEASGVTVVERSTCCSVGNNGSADGGVVDATH